MGMQKAMKVFLAVTAAIVLMVFAAPALAAVNPFEDVPLGHWTYDGFVQLVDSGVVSSLPEGVYEGERAIMRFDMAGILARTLAVTDMTRANRRDVEMLMRLVDEFKDELEALGVRVDQLRNRNNNLHSRLGCWRLSCSSPRPAIGVDSKPDTEQNAGDALTTRASARWRLIVPPPWYSRPWARFNQGNSLSEDFDSFYRYIVLKNLWYSQGFVREKTTERFEMNFVRLFFDRRTSGWTRDWGSWMAWVENRVRYGGEGNVNVQRIIRFGSRRTPVNF